jgi:hypothetical protein
MVPKWLQPALIITPTRSDPTVNGLFNTHHQPVSLGVQSRCVFCGVELDFSALLTLTPHFKH